MAGEIGKAGGTASPLAADVSRGQDVTAMFRAVEKAHGRLDALVNNAGLNVRGDFRHLSDADWVKIREVNLDGVVRVARDGFALLQASKRGSLVNVASIMGHRGLRQLTAYSATKGAVLALTRGLAVEYAPFGIRVNALAPGFVETALTARALKNPGIQKALLELHALAALRLARGDRQGGAVPCQRRCLLRHRRRARRRRRHVGRAVEPLTPETSRAAWWWSRSSAGWSRRSFVAFWAAMSLTVE